MRYAPHWDPVKDLKAVLSSLRYCMRFIQTTNSQIAIMNDYISRSRNVPIRTDSLPISLVTMIYYLSMDDMIDTAVGVDRLCQC